ncbi:hypothetical protein K438DRAFT_1865542 [Mycena galopus ATCC 62051]|nr:hypothetical protein K438DRAFT_1865542 [Mycena galopus ATCC 62051]
MSTSSFDDRLRILVLGILIPGIVLSAMVLVAFAYVASQRHSRPHLHRVSFRLLVYALVSKCVPGISPLPFLIRPLCPDLLQASLLFSASMYFCMALNLELVLIHGVDGLRMEKYYVIGSSLLVGVCNITPLAVGGQLGLYDNLCWFSNPDPILRFRWILGTQSFWLFLMASLELVCFIILLAYMIRRRMFVKRIRSDISAEMTALQHAAYSAAPILQFRAIIMRITLYPLLSCVLGFSGTTVDLYLAKHLENNELVYQCIFNARPFLYAVLAATDPSFLRAIGALRNLHPVAGSNSFQPSRRTAESQFQNSRRTIQSLYTSSLAGGNKTVGESSESMGTQSLDAAGRSQQTNTYRDSEEGIERHSNFVESRKDSIEFQI